MAQLINSFLIDPEGNLYRCYNAVGDVSKAMGNIKNRIDYNHPRFTELFSFDPFQDEECRDCHLLPVCMGGCPDRRLRIGQNRGEVCQTWKHNLQPMLEIIAASRQAKARPAPKE